jgi:ribonuclease BN (tRNA processing enzyme)
MTSDVLQLTVLGSGSARPAPHWAASGLLLQVNSTAVLFDCGTGIASRLEANIGAEALSAIVIGHLHADHWIDLAPLRYRFPWAGRMPNRLPVHLPPGGLAKIRDLASAISERPTFFDDAFDVTEYASGEPFSAGELSIRPVPAGHYVPAWSMDVVGPDGARILYAGDMGPSEELVELARGVDLLILEATLTSLAEDDPKRGHLLPEEAIDAAMRAGVGRTILVHYPPARLGYIEEACRPTEGRVVPALPGMVIEVPARERSEAVRPA